MRRMHYTVLRKPSHSLNNRAQSSDMYLEPNELYKMISLYCSLFTTPRLRRRDREKDTQTDTDRDKETNGQTDRETNRQRQDFIWTCLF